MIFHNLINEEWPESLLLCSKIKDQILVHVYPIVIAAV